MNGGQSLLDLLGHDVYGEWLVIHGHKHHPKICYAAGSATSPIVFAAGSLCANLFKNVQASARNQFYILEFDLSDVSQRGLVGRFSAWDWIVETGWQRASASSGLPASGAFGERAKPSMLAQEISSAMKEPILPWNQLINSCPKLKYVIPTDLRSLFTRLKEQHGINLLRDHNDEPTRLERTA